MSFVRPTCPPKPVGMPPKRQLSKLVKGSTVSGGSRTPLCRGRTRTIIVIRSVGKAPASLSAAGGAARRAGSLSRFHRCLCRGARLGGGLCRVKSDYGAHLRFQVDPL